MLKGHKKLYNNVSIKVDSKLAEFVSDSDLRVQIKRLFFF